MSDDRTHAVNPTITRNRDLKSTITGLRPLIRDVTTTQANYSKPYPDLLAMAESADLQYGDYDDFDGYDDIPKID